MDSPVYTNDNEVYEMLQNYVNVCHLSDLREDGHRVRDADVILFSNTLLQPKGLAEYTRPIAELIYTCPVLTPVLYGMVQYTAPLGSMNVMLYDDERWYDLTLEDDGASNLVRFGRQRVEPAHLTAGDYIITDTKLTFKASCALQTMLKTPRFAKELELDFYKTTGRMLNLCRPLNETELKGTLLKNFIAFHSEDVMEQ